MDKRSNLRRTQVDGKKYELPKEEVVIEKAVKKGLGLMEKISGLNTQLENVKRELTQIASRRREGSTTVNLKGISGSATVTYRESYDCGDRIEEIRHDLGSLFERFFVKKTVFRTTKEFKQFMMGEHALGIESPEQMKTLIRSHVKMKETKPNVKIAPVE